MRMNRSFGWLLSLGLIAVGAVTAVYFFDPSRSTAGGVTLVHRDEPHGAANKPIPIGVPVTPNLATRPEVPMSAPVFAGFSTEINNARNLRDVFNRALQRPESGGHYYARIILSKCIEARDFAKSNPNGPPVSSLSDGNRAAVRQQAYTTMLQKCDGFTDGELSHDAILALTKDSRAAQDPWVAAHGLKLSQGTEREQAGRMNRLLSSIATTKDVQLFVALAEDIDPKRGIYFDGRFYPLEPGVPFMMLAARSLAACNLGADCSAVDIDSHWQCAMHDICEGNRNERLRSMAILQFGAARGGLLFTQAQQLAPQLASAFSQQDWAKFSAPPPQ
jgi:hypothetical protein